MYLCFRGLDTCLGLVGTVSLIRPVQVTHICLLEGSGIDLTPLELPTRPFSYACVVLSDVSSVRVVPCFQSKHSGSLPSRSCAVPQGAGHFRVSPFGCRIEDFNHRFRHLVREDISSENPRLEHAVLLPDVVCGRHSVPVSKRIPLIS